MDMHRIANSKKIKAGNIFLNNISFFEAIEQIKKLSSSSDFSYVVTPNVDHMARLTEQDSSSELKFIYNQAALSLCDSRILDKLLRMKSKRVDEVIPGSTVTKYLFCDVLTDNDVILVIGVSDKYIHKLRTLFPHLKIQHINPSMGFINKEKEVDSLLEQIETINANYIFLCVGSSRQEVLASKIKEKNIVGGVGLCVGASVLFMVGAEKRAPWLVQKLHLEWVYRIVQNPRRLAIRYFKNFLCLPRIFRSL